MSTLKGLSASLLTILLVSGCAQTSELERAYSSAQMEAGRAEVKQQEYESAPEVSKASTTLGEAVCEGMGNVCDKAGKQCDACSGSVCGSVEACNQCTILCQAATRACQAATRCYDFLTSQLDVR